MIAHKVKVILGIVLVLCLAMAMPSFASPDITDADITFSVKGYYTQYGTTSTWTRGYINASGQIVSPDGAYIGYSDYIPVTSGGTVFIFYVVTSALKGISHACFYDSEHNVVAGGIDSGAPTFVSVPEGASYVRISQGFSLGNNTLIVSSPSAVDYSNYRYLFHTFDNLQFEEDGSIIIPYQAYGFTQIYLNFKFFNSVYQFSNIAFKVLSEYTGSSFYEGLLDYGDGQVLTEPYTLNGDHIETSAVASSSLNPAKFAFNIPFSHFSGFLLYVPVNIPNGNVSTSIKIKVYDFQLDGDDVSARLDVDRLLDQLDDLAVQLALPSPDLDTLLDVGGVLNNTNDTNASGIMSVIASDGGIITTMMVISVSITVLGYILFGKKEA